VLPIGDITFYTPDKGKFILDPQDDITAIESVRLSTLLAFMSSAATGAWSNVYDWLAYVDLHGLRRHFKAV
jgi:hypothetical protein